MQGLGFNPWPGKDPTCHRATGPMHHNYWTCTLEPMNYNYGSPLAYSLCSTTREATQWEACTRQLEQARVQQQRPTVAKRYRNQSFKKKILGTSLAVQWLRPHLPMKGLQVWSLLGELRSHMPQGQKTKTQNIKHCNKFNKDFKKKKNIIQVRVRPPHSSMRPLDWILWSHRCLKSIGRNHSSAFKSAKI